jgi:hypothetical protein
MPSTSGSNGSFAADLARQVDQAHEQAKSVFATQKELLDTLEQMNEHWFARAKSEAEFATAMANKLVSARSMPDMTSAYQDWLGQRMQRYVEDSITCSATSRNSLRPAHGWSTPATAAVGSDSSEPARRRSNDGFARRNS